MKEYFKEQLDAGPTAENENSTVFYIVEGESGKNMCRIHPNGIDDLSEKYECIDHSTAVPQCRSAGAQIKGLK